MKESGGKLTPYMGARVKMREKVGRELVMISTDRKF